MGIQKNVPAQKIAVFAFNELTGAPQVGDAGNITSQISKDFGASAATGDVNPTELDVVDHPGVYVFDLTQAESDADVLMVTPASSTTGIVLDPIQIFTVPKNFSTLDITAAGEVITDNASRIASQATSVDIASISGDSTAADNLELQFNGTGITGDTFPTTQAQLNNFSVGAGGLNVICEDSPDGFVLTTGLNETNTEDVTHELDGVVHSFDDDGGTIDGYYVFDVGGNGVATDFIWHGYAQGNGDNYAVYAYNWVTTSWNQIGNITGLNGTTIRIKEFKVQVNHTGTGVNLGEVRLRLYSTTGSTFATDYLLCTKSILSQSVGYANGAVWVDTLNGTEGTEAYVNGTADKPALTWTDALSIASIMGLSHFHLAAGSSITLTAAFDFKVISSQGATVNLNAQSITGAKIEGCRITGTDDGTNTSPPLFRWCRIEATALGTAVFDRCSLGSTELEFTQAGTYTFDHCYSAVAGTATPIINLGAAIGDANVNMRHYSGGIEIKNMGQTGSDLMSLEGCGQLIINANCDSGTIAIRGNFTVTDNVSGGFVAGGGIISDDARFAVDNTISADMTAVSGDTTAADNLESILDGTGATLTLDQLRINSTEAGGAIDIDNTGGPAVALKSWAGVGLEVNGTTNGIQVQAGSTGHALVLAAGAGNAFYATCSTTGTAFKLASTTGDLAPEIEAMFTTVEEATNDIKAQTDQIEFSSNNRILANVPPSKTTIGANNFLFYLESEVTTPYVVGGSEVEISRTHILDADEVVTEYTGSSVSTQWQVTVSVLQHDPAWTEEFPIDPIVRFSSSDEAIATVDDSGFVTWISDGVFNIIGISEASADSPSMRFEIELTNSTNSDTTEVTSYEADTLDAASHVLILYNSNSSDSVTLLANVQSQLPGMSTANVLDLPDVPDDYVISIFESTAKIYDLVYNWLVANESTKPIRYIISLRGVPNRDNWGGSWAGQSVGFILSILLHSRGYRSGNVFQSRSDRFTRAQYQGSTALVSTLDMGSLAATQAHISKIAVMATAGGLQADGITVQGSTTSLTGDQWYFDEKRTLQPPDYTDQFADDYSKLIDDGVSAGDITYQDDLNGTAITTGLDVAYYASWGKYNTTLGNDWPNTDNIVFSGKSGWWLGMSVESFNGVYNRPIHSDPTEWFAIDAFGGTNYENTPIGFVGHTAEPLLSGVSSRWYPSQWNQGWNAAECAWDGKKTYYFIHVGWPFVEK